MRGLVQRVREASVTWSPSPSDGSPGASPDPSPDRFVPAGQIGPGLLVLVGVTHDDDRQAARRLAEKIWHLRIFPDADGAMNASCADVGGEVLVISQFTLYADTRKGRRPSFVAAAPPELAEALVDDLVTRLSELGASVATGRFRSHMHVSLVNDGPVTLLIEV